MKKLVIGILAHVDAGKTTLSESMLYLSGKTKKLGRVDKKDAYLDTYELERDRGITIFSKQAIFEIDNTRITLLDTPGHVDFSPEMERTLQILDYAILVINGRDGVQGHTKTLWRLLDMYQVPAFLFINKMDQEGTDKDKLIHELKEELDDGCILFDQVKTDEFYDQLAMCEEAMMEEYLNTDSINELRIRKAVKNRKVFPCFFGSALKLEGVKEFMEAIGTYTIIPSYPKEFGAKIFKISRDEQGNRLTHMKLTGGKLKVKDVLTGSTWEEKVNQIRIYSGEKYKTLDETQAGDVVIVTGLSMSKPGEGLGIEKAANPPILEPVLVYQMILPKDCDYRVLLPKLRQLEEEEPELHIAWNEQLQEIQAQIMGEIQIEILQSLIESRFGVKVTFGTGRIVYKETITNVAEGVGHFEPLRHYAEVHLLLEPGEPGSGLKFYTKCSEDLLERSWQRLILTHLEEKLHKGVLTGSQITDMKITLVSGRAHNKHTEGGDFREATYRAVRQGLKEANSLLLEPYYDFYLELPENMVGRAMNDIDKMHGTWEIAHTRSEMVVLTGSAPVVTMRNYHKEVIAYTRGNGKLSCNLKGYGPCHNETKVIESIGYDSERDRENPTGSVFCSHGTSFTVPWNEVKNYMHIESYLQRKDDLVKQPIKNQVTSHDESLISLDEIDKIIDSTFYANQGKKSIWKKRGTAREDFYKSISRTRQKEIKEEYLLIDGYNIIYAWPELNELIGENMDGARMKLLDILSNYQGIRRCKIIVVFDAYLVKGHTEEISSYHNIYVVYTKEAQTADQFIEKFAQDNQGKYNITVATSDGLQQIIIRGKGCFLLSARELREDIMEANKKVKEDYENGREREHRNYLIDITAKETKKQIEELMKEDDDS